MANGNNKITTTLLVILVLIVLIGLGFGLFFGFRNFSKDGFNGTRLCKTCEEVCKYGKYCENPSLLCADRKRNICYPLEDT